MGVLYSHRVSFTIEEVGLMIYEANDKPAYNGTFIINSRILIIFQYGRRFLF